jgi:hypothetical protein
MDSNIAKIHEFITRWEKSDLNEQQGSQTHFLELCDAFGQPHPGEPDVYQFERYVEKIGGGHGRADVWKKNFFAWEYKSPGEDLDRAFNQLKQYAGGLDNPPLLVVSDMRRFIIVTNWTNTPQRSYEFSIQELEQPEKQRWLEAIWVDPRKLHPNVFADKLTQDAANDFARLSEALGDTPEAAHFLIQIAFCLFAEDMGMLPPGRREGLGFLTEMIEECQGERAFEFRDGVAQLFGLMAKGGKSFMDKFPHFNGGMFEGEAFFVPDLTADNMSSLLDVARLDWSGIEPSIFGTLFERGLDKNKRRQLGAHYTSREDIEALVRPVLMAPLEREWEAIEKTLADMPMPAPPPQKELRPAGDLWENASRADDSEPELSREAKNLLAIREGFLEKLRGMRVLDPACGSGNFLYVSLTLLKDLENRVITQPAFDSLPPALPQINPTQLYGIEINDFAYELASAVVWIGYIQWHQRNRYMKHLMQRSPILQRMDHNILHKDAILLTDNSGNPVRPAEYAEWPEVDVIVGNPPFLGASKIRSALGDEYTNLIFDLNEGGAPYGANDMAAYWFEIARRQIEQGKAKRVGLLATQGIRGSANRRVLERIKQTGDIFFAYSDREWVLDGAAVRVSMVGFDDGSETRRMLDNQPVEQINPDLTSLTDLTAARLLAENQGISYRGNQKGGDFDISGELARQMMNMPLNPSGRPNSEVIKHRYNGMDVMGRPRDVWLIDFGIHRSLEDAALYEMPFEYIKKHVAPKYASKKPRWWIHERPRPEMREKIAHLPRFIVTPHVSKYRAFAWLDPTIMPDHQLIVFARSDDYFFGVLHSRAHEVWSLRQGTQLESRPRYTPTTTFETFPMPWTPGQEPAHDPRHQAISEAARELNEKREAWLNPVRNALQEEASWQRTIKERTLTKLYNARPEWLGQAHEALDRAVFAAYGWEYPLAEEEILRRLLALNLERAGGNEA